MCGIVGYVGTRPASRILVEGLARLEFRGYDSAGLAVAHRKTLRTTKAVGRVDDLRAAIGYDPGPGRTGIARTRWATRRAQRAQRPPAHRCRGPDRGVDNGIVENAEELRAKLIADGVVFVSDTDTEVLPHLIARAAADDESRSLEEAVREALRVVEGTNGLVVLDARRPDELVVARNGSPIVLGLGDGEMFVASDVAALVRHTRQVEFFADGELATITATGYEGSRRSPPTTVDVADDAYDLDGHPDFLSKEIHEQPAALRRVLAGRLDSRFATARLDGLRLDPRELRGIRRVTFLGRGSALYAGQMGAALVEELARVPADAEQASEFRYRNPLVDPDTLYVAVSQSGETIDTLAAVEELQRKGGRVVGCVNVIGSAIARQCGAGMFIHAGPEVSVASTKAFSSMTTSFALLALLLGRVRDLSSAHGTRLVEGLRRLPDAVEQAWRARPRWRPWHARTPTRADVLPGPGAGGGRAGGRAEAEGDLLRARRGLRRCRAQARSAGVGGRDDAVRRGRARRRAGEQERLDHRADQGPRRPGDRGDERRAPRRARRRRPARPRLEPELDPILLGVPLQMLAYHCAAALGRDIDKPRNLAKSVTVE